MATLVRKADTQQEDETFLADALRVADLAAEKKAADIRGYDVRGLTFLADAFVMCTTASPPQMKAVMNAVHDGMKQAGKAPLHPLQVLARAYEPDGFPTQVVKDGDG